MKTYKIGPQKNASDYVYLLTDTGEAVHVRMTLDVRSQREEHGFLKLPGGKEAKFSLTRTIMHFGGKRKKGQKVKTRARWPLRTTLTGVGEGQVGELREFVRERGLSGTYVHDDGSVEWSGPKARREYCKAVRLYDRNAGYSDPMPDNR